MLKPFVHKYTDIKYAWLFELKYMKRSEKKDSSSTLEEKINNKVEEARKQLIKYGSSDTLGIKNSGGGNSEIDQSELKKMLHSAPYGNVKIKKGIVVFLCK